IIGTPCVQIRTSRKSSLRSRRSNRQTDSCNIKDRLANSIDPEVFFDQCVLERCRTKRRQAKPSRHETERLAQMARVEKHHAICTSNATFPPGARKHS